MKRLLKRKVEKSYLLLVGLVSVFLVVGYFSYAYFTVQTEKANVISIKAGTLSLSLSEDELYTFPDGQMQELDITITNNNPVDVKFNLYARNPDPEVQVFYFSDGSNGLWQTVPPRYGRVLAKGQKQRFLIFGYSNDKAMHTTDIRVSVGLSTASLSWPSNAVEIPAYNKVSEPVLSENMIPVTWNASSKTWVTADYDDSDWYDDYENHNWPNAVVVKKEYRNTYSQAMPSGIPISMDKIQTMWVWVPRFSYALLKGSMTGHAFRLIEDSSDLNGAIDIQFKDINNSKNTDTGTGEYENLSTSSIDQASHWKTASAFTSTIQSGRSLPGFWVGKFETGSDIDGCAPSMAYGDGANLLIKPDAMSIGSLDMGEIEDLASGLTSLDFNDSELQAIPMTDAQWNAVAYLSTSLYGKWGNTDYETTRQDLPIYKNPNQAGCGSTKTTGKGRNNASYDVTGNGTGASTTGTIYGIYDMVGGAFEKVVGCDLGANPFYKGINLSTVTYTRLYDGGVLRGGAAVQNFTDIYDPYSIFSYTNTDDLCSVSATYGAYVCQKGYGSSSEEPNGFRLVLVPVGSF